MTDGDDVDDQSVDDPDVDDQSVDDQSVDDQSVDDPDVDDAPGTDAGPSSADSSSAESERSPSSESNTDTTGSGAAESPDPAGESETATADGDSSTSGDSDSSTPDDVESQDSSAEENEDSSAASPVPTVGDGGATQSADPVGEQETFGGAPDDEEMPLTEHIEEMIRRLAKVIVVMAIVSAVTFPFADFLINWLWYSFLPGNPEACTSAAREATACPRVYHPLGLVLARLKVASLAGFVVALPVFVYQSYLFMRPGLYPHERRYYLASVPTSLLLAFVGISFAYFLVLPFIFNYFLFYSQDVAEIAFGLTETFNLILLMLGLFAAIFQIPLFIMLAIMMGVTTRRWLEAKRLYFWLGFSGFAFIFSPDPTGMAPFLVGATMIVLYELTLLLLRWTDR